jgi:hypothetical protein
MQPQNAALGQFLKLPLEQHEALLDWYLALPADGTMWADAMAKSLRERTAAKPDSAGIDSANWGM